MDSLLISSLNTLGYAVPELLACGIALGLLWIRAQPGKARQWGLAGAGLMLACALMQLAVGLYQNTMIHAMQGGSATDLGRLLALLSGVRLLVNCLSLAGLVMIVWGLCKATQPQDTARFQQPNG